jgi:hypothetical protein
MRQNENPRIYLFFKILFYVGMKKVLSLFGKNTETNCKTNQGKRKRKRN